MGQYMKNPQTALSTSQQSHLKKEKQSKTKQDNHIV